MFILHHETPIVLKLVVSLVVKPSTISREMLSSLCTKQLECGVAEFIGMSDSIYVYLYKFSEHKCCSHAEQYDFQVPLSQPLPLQLSEILTYIKSTVPKYGLSFFKSGKVCR